MSSTILDTATASAPDPDARTSAARDETSLHDEILARLRDYIVEGHVADGGRLSERQLCEMLGVSRTPLREALKVLAAEGLVELLPNRGARVRPLSAADIQELFDLMGGLEGLAGRLACEKISDEAIEKIEQLHHDMYGFYMRQDMQGYFRMNQLIHRSIVDAAANATLQATYESLAGRIRRVRFSANFARRRERWSEAMREHELILDALRRRAGSELSDILFQHLRNKGAAAIAYFAEGTATHAGAKPAKLD
ncbi:GntR family transcriptional regulator [Bradyrhizobium sp. STM 3809]|uniref:GntR family transcriptional regulator n=1 Tax=Bradyrhizobium sp. STM 3809 TaxID=551936 RepID=UPI0002409774|nr:GntR family transcriptional regulator [Bradyrhizobium sp. STM 3809]CCE00986.1 putative transcriptional regulatory protein, GntR family [Bradyrhizobium sp. STM 3809]